MEKVLNILFESSKVGNIEQVKYTIEVLGANVQSNNNQAVKYAAQYGHLDVFIFI